ncbi:MAG TPA: MauE/DoxX family redox-associated membrane protein [Acidimicrobiia bacterium]|nr:MauE/DoxX family redox-associated membrane protein [Acidimicrobiia bacterium]
MLAGPFVVAATLLGVGGASKVLEPADTARALGTLGLPSSPALVRAGGAAELVIAVGALTFGNRGFAVLLGLSYLGLLAFVVLALVRHAPLSTCGCFGKADTPPSAIHVTVNGLAVLVAAAVVVEPGVGLPDVLAGQPLLGLPFLLLAAVSVYLTFLSLTVLPRAVAGPGRR